jgi:hypothetical protein
MCVASFEDPFLFGRQLERSFAALCPSSDASLTRAWTRLTVAVLASSAFFLFWPIIAVMTMIAMATIAALAAPFPRLRSESA